MNAADVLVLALVAAALAGAGWLWRAGRRRGGCSGGCAHCTGCGGPQTPCTRRATDDKGGSLWQR